MLQTMAGHDLLAKFYHDIHPSRPNEWEIEELFEGLEELEVLQRRLLLAQVPAIWPVSHALCFEFLKAGVEILRLISPDLLPEFVRQLLRMYERRGLQGTRELIADVDGIFLAALRGESGIAFVSIATRLLHFIRGVSGKLLQLAAADLPATDTETIFAPLWIGIFPRKVDNEWLYKIVVTLQWAHLVQGVYSLPPQGDSDILLNGFRDEPLARDLFAVKRLYSAWRLIAQELPGLAAGQGKIRDCLVTALSDEEGCSLRQQLMHKLLLEIFSEPMNPVPGRSGMLEAKSLSELYRICEKTAGDYQFSDLVLLLLGQFDFRRASEKISQLREEREKKFVQLAALFLDSHKTDAAEKQENDVASASADSAVIVLQNMLEATRENETGQKRLDNDVAVKLPEELLEIAREIVNDMNSIPEAYFQAAAGLAGVGFNRRAGAATEGDQLLDTSPQAWLYDEWDYRRDGYRSDWCVVYEKSLNEVQSGFVQKTLLKYEAPLKRLRRQFEALRTSQRFIRRQRDGDEIDIDALIDSLGDTSAGYAPSDRLFVKLLRDDRDITTMFLVDMSNSTEGWVGVALKETLVLLAEALEAAQDRYGIYGFSGMRRSRSEVYKIKAPHEKYTSLIQRRIAGIVPMEYTRMGPAIRHICRRLAEEQSRIRILIVLSDGKPEDYDDYKGQYAIEDTRKALLEARGNGIFVFCITIDRTAHDYLEHMFGRGNYIFVDDLARLPEKMTEMYRLLTS